MASYKDLVKLIRLGTSPERIMEKLDVCPSELRRMLTGRRLRESLKVCCDGVSRHSQDGARHAEQAGGTGRGRLVGDGEEGVLGLAG